MIGSLLQQLAKGLLGDDCYCTVILNLLRHLLSNFATSTPFWSLSRSLRKSLSTLLSGQLNFNQGQLCLLPPAEGAAGGEKGRRKQWEGRRVYSWWWTTQWRVIMPSHSATIICGFARETAFSIFSQQLLSFVWKVFTEWKLLRFL